MRVDNLEEANKRLEWYEKRAGPYFDKRGPGNIKNLFRMPTMQEGIILALLILVIIISLAFQQNLATCQFAVDEYNKARAPVDLNAGAGNISNLISNTGGQSIVKEDGSNGEG